MSETPEHDGDWTDWDIDINLPLYTRDYIRQYHTPHSPKPTPDHIEALEYLRDAVAGQPTNVPPELLEGENNEH